MRSSVGLAIQPTDLREIRADRDAGEQCGRRQLLWPVVVAGQNIVLHAIRASDGRHRSYRIDRIEGVQTTGQSFVPRYAVELSPQGGAAIVPSATRSGTVARPLLSPP